MKAGRKTGKVHHFTPPAMGEVDPPMADVDEVASTYAFPSKVRCPKCGSTSTHSEGSHGEVQYRQCQGAPCRHRFKVYGSKI